MSKDKRNWRKYNEKLVKRGEFYISLDFIENWDKELEEMNKNKKGRPYDFHSFMVFLAFIHVAFLPSDRWRDF